MRIPVYVPLIAVAALVGAGIYGEGVHRHHMMMASTTASPADSQAAPADSAAKSAKPAPKRMAAKPRHETQLANSAPPSSTAHARPLLPEGGLVKITAKVTATDANTLTVQRDPNEAQVRVQLAPNRDWYWPYVADHSAQQPGVGSVVTVYGRAHDVVANEPVVDADAVYLPQSNTMYYSNGKNQMSNATATGDRSRVRFTAYYRSAG